MLSEPSQLKSLVLRTCRLTVARRGLNVLALTPFGASERNEQWTLNNGSEISALSAAQIFQKAGNIAAARTSAVLCQT